MVLDIFTFSVLAGNQIQSLSLSTLNTEGPSLGFEVCYILPHLNISCLKDSETSIQEEGSTGTSLSNSRGTLS